MADQGQGQTTPAPGAGSHLQPLSQGARGGSGPQPRPASQGGGDDGDGGPANTSAIPDALARTASQAGNRPAADVWLDEDDGTPAGDALGDALSDALQGAGMAAHTAQMRVQARQQLREFLRAVPRREEEATLALVRADGSTRIYTRAELSAAIDRLRPRQRQIMRLAVEERWSRQRVCEYLRHISIKTFERDQVEALDLLAQL